MNQKERLLTALKRNIPDRVPNFEVWWGGNEGIEGYFLGRPVKNEVDSVKFAKKIGWGSVNGGYFGFSGGVSLEASNGSSHYAGGSWRTWKDYENLKFPHDSLEENLIHLKKISKIANNEGLATHIYILSSFHATCTSMGFEHFALACYDDLKLVEAFMDKVEEYNWLVLKRILDEVKIDFIVLDNDCAYKNGLMVSPELFEKLWFKRTEKTMEILKDRGVTYIMHTDGKVDEVIPFLIKLGFSALHGIEKACNNLGKIKEKFGKEISLLGNMDVVDLTKKNKKEIIEETKNMLNQGMVNGGYIAGCNTLVAKYIPVENYLTMIRAIEEYGDYK